MTDAPCQLLEWDTEFWGVKIARVAAESMTDKSREEVDAWCRDNEISCVYFLARTEDSETTFAAERGEFFYTDARITLRKEVRGRREEMPGVHIREARPGDLEGLQAIARSSHETTRFYHDPHFPDDRCGELYAQWIRSAYDSGATVLVVDDGGRAVAYVTCELKTPEQGQIGLIAVDPPMREKRLATALGTASHNWMYEAGVNHVMAVTQARNVAALQFIESQGYVIDSTHIWFHKWYDR
ncbi:MAG: dTDP-4-amino-4,6-dideoxy-D-galactose acyltransferase [Gaiellaceae bacterium]|nr:dTDP-4-amino-4,6-dideoxy-D-galactose acyltransferase [Gaiellaceae bacterium]